MTFWEGLELNLKNWSISYLLYILTSFLLSHNSSSFSFLFFISMGREGIFEIFCIYYCYLGSSWLILVCLGQMLIETLSLVPAVLRNRVIQLDND